MAQKTLMAVFAHPDDESFGTGGTLSLYAARGYRVELVCATRGEAGEISDPTLATPETLPQVRENELRCAARGMGINPPIFLGYRDSGMMGTPQNDDPRCLWQADRREAVGKVTRLIREMRPDVVITFEPNGGYGHPDHVAIHQITVAAVAAAADPAQYAQQIAGGLAPYAVKKFYFTALPKRFFAKMAEKLTAAGVDLSKMNAVREGNLAEWGMPDEMVTTVLDVSSVLDKKVASFWCHRTQLNPNGPFTMVLRMGGDVWSEPMGREYYMRVQPPFAAGEPEETDLFAGLE
jgi:N-acetyl-1-D-myo-inositol-2-amino-2-deoxy-alpha-D-glucopyranoside deacetylase